MFVRTRQQPEHPVFAVRGLEDLLCEADHVDVVTLEGSGSIREVVAALLSYQPWWVTALMRLRAVLAWVLRLKQVSSGATGSLRPDEVPMEPGAAIRFFTVERVDEDRYWLAGAADRHLAGTLGVIRETGASGSERSHVTTIVSYRHWTGPLYFFLIRPFHHLILYCMVRRTATRLGLRYGGMHLRLRPTRTPGRTA